MNRYLGWAIGYDSITREHWASKGGVTLRNTDSGSLRRMIEQHEREIERETRVMRRGV